MEWFRGNYNRDYAPNTRETVRRQTLHQNVADGIAVYNPDDPSRAVNSPLTVYQISPIALELIHSYKTQKWNDNFAVFLSRQDSLARQYAMPRDMAKIPIQIKNDLHIKLSPGSHSQLIREIVEEFAPRFTQGSSLIYVGDTGEKWGYADQNLLEKLGISTFSHGKMPDVVLYDKEKDWLFLLESVTSHGPMDGKRVQELKEIFKKGKRIFISAFPNRFTMARFLSNLALETDVWVAEFPDHLIHFNGERFLGPYN